jgi:uridine kinase
MKKPLIIAISGGSGSGKTFLAEAINNELGDQANILSQDNYYIDQSDKFDGDGGSVNFDHPESIDFELLAAHLKLLKENETISMPQYDFATHTRSEETIDFEPAPIIVVDGILILCSQELREIFDEIVFVETPEDIRFERRLKRDVEERGRTPEGVKVQFSKQVKPMHDQFVEPCKSCADIVSSGIKMQDLYDTINHFKNYLKD